MSIIFPVGRGRFVVLTDMDGFLKPSGGSDMSAISTLPRRRASWAVLSAVAMLTGPASFALAAKPEAAAHAPRVQDNAKVFSADAVAKANDIIADIHANTKTHKQVVVETYTKVPDGFADANA